MRRLQMFLLFSMRRLQMFLLFSMRRLQMFHTHLRICCDIHVRWREKHLEYCDPMRNISHLRHANMVDFDKI